jgi:CubicO group peptidase (beta-lactamase class C family)
MKLTDQLNIARTVEPGYEPVREAFVANFAERGEVGAARCICRDGVAVVDLWGGVRDPRSGGAWRPDAMVAVNSATKGMAVIVMALAQSRGWLDYDERACTYWPEFTWAYFRPAAVIDVRAGVTSAAKLNAWEFVD